MQFQKGHKLNIGENNAMFGKKRPAYIGQAVAEANRKRVWSEEMRLKQGLINKGKKQPQELIDRRIKRGKDSKLYKGEDITYGSLHQWVARELGRPTRCSGCGIDGLTGSKIHWSNISGDYKRELSDWQRLCVSCHKRYDRSRRIHEV